MRKTKPEMGYRCDRVQPIWPETLSFSNPGFAQRVFGCLLYTSNVRVALDLTEEWDKAVEGQSGLTMGCVVVRSEFAQNNKEALDSFLEEYTASLRCV